MKIVTILGARPNFVKAYLISKELKNRNHEEIIIHTGQHYDYQMSEVFFKDLEIPAPNYNLNLRSTQINDMVHEIQEIISREKPDLTLVYGDTNSTLAGAVASFLNHVPIAHVEAGERCYDFEMPEERNRVIIDHYSTWLFCATENATHNLQREKVTTNIFFTGNLMHDSVLHNLEPIAANSVLAKHTIDSKKYVLVTLHRPQNVDSPETVQRLLRIFENVSFPMVLPLHPRTKENLTKFGLLDTFKDKFILTDPLNYLDTLTMIKNAKFVLTDSGGVQTEAFSLHTPCVTFLNETVWTDTVEQGWNKVVALDEKKAADAIHYFTHNNPQPSTSHIFGDGNAHQKIIDILERNEK